MFDATVIKLKYVEAESVVSVNDEPDVMPEILRVEITGPEARIVPETSRAFDGTIPTPSHRLERSAWRAGAVADVDWTTSVLEVVGLYPALLPM